MKIDVLTIFPKMFGPLSQSLIGKAQKKDLVEIKVHNLRNWTKDKHRSVDDRPFGGGPGMVFRVDIVDRALKDLKSKNSKIILLSPQGKVFNQKKARSLSQLDHLILVCGHYEGFDERVREHLVDEQISIGDYVLTGGEIPAMVIIDTIVRLIPSVVGKPKSLEQESFSHPDSLEQNLLDYPEYTRPENYRGWKVPKVLLSGNHAKISQWRREKALEKTKKLRPDLLKPKLGAET